jgi:hypothetical protein
LEENVHGKDLEDLEKDYVVVIEQKDVIQNLVNVDLFQKNVHGHQN